MDVTLASKSAAIEVTVSGALLQEHVHSCTSKVCPDDLRGWCLAIWRVTNAHSLQPSAPMLVEPQAVLLYVFHARGGSSCRVEISLWSCVTHDVELQPRGPVDVTVEHTPLLLVLQLPLSLPGWWLLPPVMADRAVEHSCQTGGRCAAAAGMAQCNILWF